MTSIQVLALVLLPMLSALTGVNGQKPTCTPLGRECISEAFCNATSRRCECPPPTKGNGLLECVDEDCHLCESCADPKIKTFFGAQASLKLPCMHCLARFFVPQLNPMSPGMVCSVLVLGLNRLIINGRYFAEEVKTIVSVGSLDGNSYTKLLSNVEIELTREGHTISTETQIYPQSVEWGRNTTQPFLGLTVSINYDQDNFAVLTLQECAVRIKFRPFRPEEQDTAQRQLPGISVKTPGNADFRSSFLGLGGCLCGKPDDLDPPGSRTLWDEAAVRRLRNPTQLCIWAMLKSAVFQKSGEYKTECYYAISTFSKCPADRRFDAVRVCSPIVARRRILRCLLKKAPYSDYYNPVVVFYKCLRYMCQRDDFYTCLQARGPLTECSVSRFFPELNCGDNRLTH